MTFLEEVQALGSTVPVHVCKVKLFIETQDPKGKDPVTEADLQSAREKNTLKAIHRALVNRGFKFSDTVLSNHLKHECRCAREDKA
jgi:hypothetical protein